MASLLIANPKITARSSPFRTVWPDLFSSRSKLREQVGQLMPDCPIDLLLAVMDQQRVEGNQLLLEISPAGATHQASVPNNANVRSQQHRSIFAEQRARLVFQLRVPTLRQLCDGWSASGLN